MTFAPCSACAESTGAGLPPARLRPHLVRKCGSLGSAVPPVSAHRIPHPGEFLSHGLSLRSPHRRLLKYYEALIDVYSNTVHYSYTYRYSYIRTFALLRLMN